MKGNRKYYISLHGEAQEVSREVYQAYYQGKRKEKYIYERDQAHENHILDISGMEELEFESGYCLASAQPSIDDLLLAKELHNHLHQCLQMLPEADRALIQAIYFSGETESSYAKKIGLTQPGISKRHKKILAKLRKFMNNL
ncbi:MAG: sigma-70 family RNA polymerase sigma factor [Firmicutes bacterium]|nr:sigma-70 family RNA polymerase sigma factor [Bacillota bacterium]